jgi:hypothetical protein
MTTIEMTAGSIAPATIEPQELDMLASAIRAGLNTISSHLQSALRVALQVGEDLLNAQTQVAKGQWGHWLQQNCDLQERTAQLYKQLAENRELVETSLNINPDLSIRAARRLIMTPRAKQTCNAVTARNGNSVATRSVNGISGPNSPRPDLLHLWEKSEPRQQRAVLDSMPRDKLLAILPEGFGLLLAAPAVTNGFKPALLPDGDDGLGIPAFLDRRPRISTGNGAATNGATPN